MNKSKTLCAVPCYNESVNYDELITDINETLANKVTILFIDDGSNDNTRELIKASGHEYIFHEQNKGYGGAVKTGLSYALENGFDFMVTFPGDHQRQGEDVLRLLDEISKRNLDVVVGSKFHIYSEKYGPIRRRIGNIIFSKIARYLWSSPIEDVLSGFKVYRCAKVRDFYQDLPERYPFDIVFSLYASVFGLLLAEIPVQCRYDENTTKMRSVIMVSMKMFMSLFLYALKPKKKFNSSALREGKSVGE